MASQSTVYQANLDHLQTHITHAEQQRRKYAKLIDADDDPSATLVAELKKYEREKATFQEQKRQLEMGGPASSGA